MSKTPKPFNFGRRTPPATPPCSVKHDSPPSSLLPSSSLDTWNAVSTIQAQTERCRFLEAQLVVARQNRTTFLDEFKAMRQTMEVISTGAAEMRRELEDERNRTARAEKSLRETEQKREQAERALEEERERSWQMRNSMKSQRDLNQSADELEAVVCGRYYNQWELISRLKRHSDIPMLQFQDVPWPTFKLAVSLEDITLKELKRFLRALSRSESGNERYTRKMIKDWLLVWHPDKFRGKWLPYVTESDKNLVHRGW